ncbi:hypothetical protein CCACVL1_20718 [Corchorus capsularis]|uniref:PGG domain-containing protein n=1 Tax=Corchorus capsularis TaxID=210143 RepID=A0A1R3HA65_COCAP|nr:hypothetical protein CCACVL1_20718 [Corchorus capsularis]
MPSFSAPLHDDDDDCISVYTDYSMEDEASILSKHPRLFEAAAIAATGDWETAIRIFGQQPFSGHPRSSVVDNNKDPSSSQSHANTGNDPSTSQAHDNNSSMPAGGNETKDLNYYLPLYKAALKGDWETARIFFEQDPNAVNARINDRLKTALHLAVGTGRSNNFVKKLVELMTAADLALQDDNRETSLSIAATVGNLEAAKLMVEKNPELPNIRDKESAVPLHRAVQYHHKDIVLYLLRVTSDDIQPSPYAGESGVTILLLLVMVGFYDVALDLLQRYPNMARSHVFGGKTPLSILAVKPCDFPSGCGFNSWQRLIYYCVPPNLDKFIKNKNRADTENPAENSEMHACISSSLRKHMSYVWQKMHPTLWDVVEKLVPHIKHIRDTKMMHDQVLQIVRKLCKEAAELDFSQAISLLKMPLLMAAEYGIPEIIEEIAEELPPVLWTIDAQKRDLFKRAVLNRREKVFNLLYQMSEHKRYLIQSEDILGNNILHLAGNLAPRHQLNLVSGAALQMQRELQWYKEVEKFLYPAYREIANSEGKTPSMVFTEAHKNLVIEGEKWMKDTANSCTVVAALIATVVFAAAITVPGGNGDNGYPIFTVDKTFIIFAVSDALSLFSSTAAILMFLSILTARYAEEDFLYALPKRLIMGLLTLFISITSMMIAFSSTLYLVFGEDKTWILISVAGSACLLVALFVYLQFPLLLVMINSTYGSGIFGKPSQRPLF